MLPKREPGQSSQPSPTVLSNCPQCNAELAVLRVIAGRAGVEYWTMLCTTCGGIHLDIVRNSPARIMQDSG